MLSPIIETPPNGPTSERKCPKGGPCVAVIKNGTWVCKNCGNAMGPGFTENYSFALRTVDLVAPVGLSALEVWGLIASFVGIGQIFRDREELETYILQEIVLRINGQAINEQEFGWARQVMKKHMPELEKRLP